jgi:hypothetical protein
MTATLRKTSVLIALFVTIVFGVFLFNQTVQIVQSARTVNPVFGDGVMWALIFVYCVLLITPVVLWFKVPKRMSPPAVPEGEEYDRFMLDFRRRLSRNARLRGVPLSTPERETRNPPCSNSSGCEAAWFDSSGRHLETVEGSRELKLRKNGENIQQAYSTRRRGA